MKKRRRVFKRFCAGMNAFILVCALATNAGAIFFEKKYLVRQVEGEDVLCDPYVVQKDEYVILLLRQRGDIADKDFPLFLRLFRALNPKVKDVDTIYPNQRILIPLKILPPNTVEGQSSGTVSIPVITITNLPETIRQHSETYRIQYGEWVSRLISQRFGPEGSETYRQGMELFKQLNPSIKNVNVVREGQMVRLPDPAIQNSPVYSALFDQSGKLVDEAQMPVEPTESVQETVAEVQPETTIKEEAPDTSSENDAAKKGDKKSSTAADTPEGKIAVPLPVDLRGFSDQSEFKKAAAILDADLLNSGEYFFPRPGKEDLRLILAETPLMIFDGGVKLLFVKGDWLSATDLKVIETNWPGTHIVRFDMRTELQTLLRIIIPLIDSDGYEKRIDIQDRGVTVAVRGQYIYDPPGHPGKICLNIVETPEMRVPSSICAYLKTQGITVRDWLEGDYPSETAPEEASDWRSFPDPDILYVAGSSAPLMVRLLTDALGYPYQEGIEISFPYAGFQINALTNLLSLGPDDEILLDYGDLGGDAIESIEKTGFRIAHIDRTMPYRGLIQRLSELVPATFVGDPIFWTARRPRLYNSSLQVPGFLISAERGDQVQKVLVTDAALPERIASYLEESGIRLMRVLE